MEEPEALAPPAVKVKRPSRSSKKKSYVELPADALKTPLEIIFSGVGKLRGAHWALEPQEARALSESIVGVIAFIPLPERETALGLAIGNLTATLGAIVIQRVMFEQMMGLTSPKPSPAPAPFNAPPAYSPSPSSSQAAASANGHAEAADLLEQLIAQP